MWRWAEMRELEERRAAMPKSGLTIPGLPRSKGSLRQQIYQRLERQVMDVVEAEVERQMKVLVEAEARKVTPKPLAIHDGFMIAAKVDTAAIERAVLEQTGFKITLSESVIGSREAVKAEDEDTVAYIRTVLHALGEGVK
jgi:hypothetical protein